jgi:dsDNA-specific endonuclease/ATPase MutS2
MLRNPDYSLQLQDQLVTVRNGRFVIPVRSEQKHGVDGIVHGTSSSGATVFMEPLAVLSLNNDMVRLQEQEMREIARILAELSALIQASLPQLSFRQSPLRPRIRLLAPRIFKRRPAESGEGTPSVA